VEVNEAMTASVIEAVLENRPHPRYGDLSRERVSIPYGDVLALGVLLEFLLDNPQSPIGDELKGVVATLRGRFMDAGATAQRRLGMVPEGPS